MEANLRHARLYILQALDDAIRDLASDLNRLIMEQNASPNFSSFQNKVELNVGSR